MLAPVNTPTSAVSRFAAYLAPDADGGRRRVWLPVPCRVSCQAARPPLASAAQLGSEPVRAGLGFKTRASGRVSQVLTR